MKRIHSMILAAVSAIAGIAALGFAQLEFLRFRIPQNNPPPTELVIARWRFNTNGRIGHMGWSHNYPDAEIHLNQMVSETTLMNVDPESYRIVDLGSPEVFNYPFAYVSEPGEMDLSESELVNLREFIDRGGFIIVDDFDGPWQWDQFRRQMYRAFPERSLVPLRADQEIFHTFYDIADLSIWGPYVPGEDPIFYGFPNSRGDLAMFVCFNNDFANFWDWIDNGRYPLKPSSEAFRMGINFVIYATTH
jgi:hypothetical protein